MLKPVSVFLMKFSPMLNVISAAKAQNLPALRNEQNSYIRKITKKLKIKNLAKMNWEIIFHRYDSMVGNVYNFRVSSFEMLAGLGEPCFV